MTKGNSVDKIDILIADQAFRRWALSNDKTGNQTWNSLVLRYDATISEIKIARELVRLSTQPEPEFSKADANQLWNRIDSSISGQEPKQNTFRNSSKSSVEKKSKNYFKEWRFAMAAAILILLLYGTAVNFDMDISKQQGQEVATITKSVTKGQKLRIFLPDGSRAILNSGSEIKYPEKFEDHKREVAIKGEVFFEVTKDSLSPFIVRSKHALIEVLGTSFNVVDNDKENAVVSLLEGKLKVKPNVLDNENSHTNPLILQPGEEVSLTKEDQVLTKRNITNYDGLLWRDGVLVFHNAQMSDVFEKLERWYGVEFVYSRVMDTEEFLTGRFKNEYLDNVLKSINYTVKFDYEIEGDTVYIEP